MRQHRSITIISGLALCGLLTACTSNSAGKTEPRKAEGLEDIERDGKKGKKKRAKVEQAPLPPIPNEPVAVVNGVEISNKAFRSIYDLKVQKYADRDKTMPPTADRRYRRSIVERLVYHELLRQEAEKLGISYDEAKLEERLRVQKEGVSDWEAHLRRRGESDASLRDIYIKELLELAILEHTGVLVVQPNDLQAEYEKFRTSFDKPVERVRVSHILVRIGPDPKDPTRPKGAPSEADQKKYEAEALAKAQALAEQARAPGADFAKIAETSSDGPSARKGGDLNIVQPDRMPKEFSDVAFSIPIGQVSDPVKTKFGYHVIKVAAKYPAGLLPLAAVEDQLRERLDLTKLRDGRQKLRERLMAEGKIVDNMDKWLGPEPNRPQPPRGHGGHGDQKAKGPKAGKKPGKGREAQPDPQPTGASADPATLGRQPEKKPEGAKPAGKTNPETGEKQPIPQ